MSQYKPLDDIESLENEEKYHDSSSGRPSDSTQLLRESPDHCLCACHEQKTFRWLQILQLSHLVLRIANLILFISSLVILFFSYRHVKKLERNENNSLLRMTSSYSPLLDKIPISLTSTMTNGSFFPQNPPSIYQQQPSPEVDAAWMRLADTHGIAVTASEIEKMGRNPAESYPFPPEYYVPGHEPGEKTYLGFVNVLHQVHCLNSFRKMGYPDYYGKFWEDDPQHAGGFPWNEHLAHCQYNLLQTLMCHSDLDVITFNKVKGTPGPFPDFGVERKCRDFDAVLKWKEDNQVNVDLDSEWARMFDLPEGIIELEPEGRSKPPL